MKRETVNYFAVGLFVLAGLAVLLFALFQIIRGTGERDIYYTQYQNVAGISLGTQVTYEGYTFGQVSAVRPQRTGQGMAYQVELKVERGWQIPVDSVARIHSEGLLADTVINISEGKAPNFLEPGGILEGEEGVDLLATMAAVASDVGMLSAHARPLLENLNRSAQQVGGELEQRLPPIFDAIDALVARLDASATHLSGMLNSDTEAQARRVLSNFDAAAADFRTLAGGLVDVKQGAQQLLSSLDNLVVQSEPELQQALSDLRRVLAQVARYSDDILQNLDSTSRNMSEFSRQVRENPGRLLGGAIPQDRGTRGE